MKRNQIRSPHWSDPLTGWFFRIAASGLVPARWFLPSLPPKKARAATTGILAIEIVSHCWQYSHFLVYQLSSLVKFPPIKAKVTMTIFYSVEDTATAAILEYFGAMEVPGVIWNWQPLPKEQLFRRGIGRNKAALATEADWVWFTDCDLLFRENCLDTLAEALQGRRDALVYPRQERCTSLLTDADPMLRVDLQKPRLVDINADKFTLQERTRATGPLQITHGDVARACGYCDSLGIYQTPSDHWCKAYEDRAFRWLLRTQGTPLDIPNVYRIRHVFKGRYTGNTLHSKIRSRIRRFTSWWKEYWRQS